MEDTPVDSWGAKVASMLPECEYLVFGLDDYLPNDYLSEDLLEEALLIVLDNDYDRFELGWGASRKNGFIESKNPKPHLIYGDDTPYSVSCQFSIWNRQSLYDALTKHTSPWDFEVNGKVKSACFSSRSDNKVPFRWVEESCISNRAKGKVNILGLNPDDIKGLQDWGVFPNQEKLIYGWVGESKLPDNKGGEKYSFVYNKKQ
jgi:hypothetical protein